MSLTDAARARILRDIVRGRIRPNDRVVVTRLADAYGMSRTPVREALKRLEVTRVVERTSRRSGFQVVRPQPRDVRDLVDMLRVLEVRATRELASLPTTDRTDVSKRLRSLPIDAPGSHAFHSAIGTSTPNAYLADALRAVHDRLAPVWGAVCESCCKEGAHHRVATSLTRSGETATATIARHLDDLAATTAGYRP